MTSADLGDRYASLSCPDWVLPELIAVGVSIERQEWRLDHPLGETTFENVRDGLMDHGCAGWVRLRSNIYVTGDGRPFPSFAEAGPPLAAEWTFGKSASARAQIERPDGSLQMIFIRERELAADGALRNGESRAMRQVIEVLRDPIDPETDPPQPLATLVYHVFWGADEDDPSAIRRLFSRFVRFGATSANGKARR